ATAVVKVDHTVPTASLGGTISEDARVGTHRANYTIAVAGTDGTSSAPQSGVASAELLIDGMPYAKVPVACAGSTNCALESQTLILVSSQFSVGTHVLELVVKDAVGNKTVKTLSFTIARDTTAPSATTSGGLVEGPEGWVGQKTYPVKTIAKDAQSG